MRRLSPPDIATADLGLHPTDLRSVLDPPKHTATLPL